MRTPAIKQKRSFTLSPNSIAFLERLRKKRKVSSCSMVLDDLISEAQRRQRKAEVHKAMDDYYSSLTDEEIAEDRAWGEFGIEQASKAKDWA
jgi:hypothetical protein